MTTTKNGVTLKRTATTVLLGLFTLLSAEAQQKNGGGALSPSRAQPSSAKRGSPLPQLTVEKALPGYLTLNYRIVPDVAGMTAAWIEVWDSSQLQDKINVAVKPSGSIDDVRVTDYTDYNTPEELYIALLDPDVPVQCIDNCTLEDAQRVWPTSQLRIGSAPWTFPWPYLDDQFVRLVVGSPATTLVLSGTYLQKDTRVWMAERTTVESEGYHYKALQSVSTEYLDMHHVRVMLPGSLSSSPRTVVLYALPSKEQVREHPELQEPPLDASENITNLPGNPDTVRTATLSVVCAESPRLDSLAPEKPLADAADNNDDFYVALYGSGFNKGSTLVLNDNPMTVGDFGADFVSPDEVRLPVDSATLVNALGHGLAIWVKNDKQGCGLSDSRVLNVQPTADLQAKPLPGRIIITHPYPVPLMTQVSPNEMELRVEGENFRANDTTTAMVHLDTDQDYVPLKTVFVSSHDLRVWLPRALWSKPRLMFRFVIQTAAGERSTEAVEPQ